VGSVKKTTEEVTEIRRQRVAAEAIGSVNRKWTQLRGLAGGRQSKEVAEAIESGRKCAEESEDE